MKTHRRIALAAAAAGLGLAGLALPAAAAAPPTVTALSAHQAAYWGGTTVTVYGTNFTGVTGVLFGATGGGGLHVVSPTQLTIVTPERSYGSVNLRVVTSSGTSPKSAADTFHFVRPTMDDPIQGGQSARQEQRASAQVRARHRTPATARAAKQWTVAMATTAVKRAESWLALPYSWAGGRASSPTYGVCSGNGGDFDCHVVGFDCSGLVLYAWGPYRHLAHYAQTQHTQAGKFHPTIGELVPGDLVFFSAYIPNGIGHVAIYIGNGMVVQAEQSGTPVEVSRLVDVIAFSGSYRGATRPMSTGQQAAGPTVSTISGPEPASGGLATITGTGLGNATSVKVGSTMVYSFVQRSANRLVVRLPAHSAGAARVIVSNPWGAAAGVVTYVAAPHLSSLTPNTGPLSGTTTVITGQNLGSVSRVTVDSTPVAFTILSPTRISVTLPSHLPGTVPVVAYSSYGTSNSEPFTYALVAPDPSPTPSPSGAIRSAPAGAPAAPHGALRHS